MHFKRVLIISSVLAATFATQAAAEDQRVTQERAGVTVFRGSPTMYVEEPPVSNTTPRRVIKGGLNLWIYNQETNEVMACDLLNNVYGHPVVRCGTN